MSDIEKYIDDSYVPVEAFRRICDEMPGVKFIIAERKISELLMNIAISSKLSEVVSRSAQDFDFRTAFSEAKISSGKRQTLMPIGGRAKQIAFSMHLLYAIDVKAFPLQEFLEEYYYSPSGLNFSFSLFAHSIILPLKANIDAELELLAQPSIDEQDVPTNETPITSTAPTPTPEADENLPSTLPEDVKEDVIDRITDICIITRNESDFTAVEKKEIYDGATILRKAVLNGKADEIRQSLVEFASIIKNGRLMDKLGEKVSDLDETLTHFGV